MQYISKKIDHTSKQINRSNLAVSHSDTPIEINGKVNTESLLIELQQSPFTERFIMDVGVDEVGRGPLYGSVVVSAVILPSAYSGKIEDKLLVDTPLALLTDSKKLTDSRRKHMFSLIEQHALAHITVNVPAHVIDDINILQATLMGMSLACETIMVAITTHITSNLTRMSSELSSLLGHIQFRLLIDGNKIPLLNWQSLQNHGLGSEFGEHVIAEAWVKGDARHTAIAAASVLAKVTRDKMMEHDGIIYPDYGLQTHKGYPTKGHIQAIQKLGVLPQHRRSFKPVREALL